MSIYVYLQVISSEIQMNLGKKQTTGDKYKILFSIKFHLRPHSFRASSGISAVASRFRVSSQDFKPCLKYIYIYIYITSYIIHMMSYDVLACCHIFCLGLWLFLSHFSGPTGSFRMLALYILCSYIPNRGYGLHPVPRNEHLGPHKQSLS